MGEGGYTCLSRYFFLINKPDYDLRVLSVQQFAMHWAFTSSDFFVL